MTDATRRPEAADSPAERSRGPLISDERRPESYRTRPVEERVERSRYARQILSGAEVVPPARLSSSWVDPASGLTESQRTYLIALGVLLVVGLVLWVTVGLSVASVIFFILALGLIGGWLAF